MNSTRALTLVFWLSSPMVATALDPGKAMTQYVHEVWGTGDGLPQNTITAIVQTRDGYLWLGTREGLVRFDGVRFTVFDTQSTPELGHNFVLCLTEDREGRLWVGSAGGGLARFEHGRFTRFSMEQGLGSEQVSSIFEDRRGARGRADGRFESTRFRPRAR